jgi:hypothetical protein
MVRSADLNIEEAEAVAIEDDDDEEDEDIFDRSLRSRSICETYTPRKR